MHSSRYLKFTKNDVQWKCAEGTSCLCGEGVAYEFDNPLEMDNEVGYNLLDCWQRTVSMFAIGGLWRAYIVRKLFWFVDSGFPTDCPSLYIAPGFSWTLIHSGCGIDYVEKNVGSTCKVERAEA